MKRGLACLLAVLLLLCTACSGKANLDDEAFMPLPSEKFSWSSTLDDIQKLYPDGSLTTASDTVFYSVSQGDFGQVFGTDIKEILFMFYPTLPYNGKENPTTLMMVSYTLDSSDYDGLFEQVTKKYGEKTNEEATNDRGVE